MPMYYWNCSYCDSEYAEMRKIDERDAPSNCPSCGSNGARTVESPMVMNHSVPDGVRRFGEVRRWREIEKLRRAETDKTEKAKLTAEQAKITKNDVVK